MLAGVNGAGKSSVAGEAILKAGGEFYNPDKMAQRLRQIQPTYSQEQANALVWEMGRQGLERALIQEKFFAFETTLGGKTITRMLISGAQQGAEIHLNFVGLDSVELHIERVRKRVAAGGHPITEEAIRKRYRTSRDNLISLIPYLATLQIYDNSAEADPELGLNPEPVRLLRMEHNVITYHAPLDRIPTWAKPLLAAAFKSTNPPT